MRFLSEPDGWWAFNEVYDGEHYVIVDDDHQVDEGERISLRFLAAALDVTQDKVIALKMPKTVAEELNRHFERRGTLTDRDYELGREGSGLDTEYFVMPDDKRKRNVRKYDVPDLEAILVREIEGEPEEEEQPRRRVTRSGSKSTKRSTGSKPKRSTSTNTTAKRSVRRVKR